MRRGCVVWSSWALQQVAPSSVSFDGFRQRQSAWGENGVTIECAAKEFIADKGYVDSDKSVTTDCLQSELDGVPEPRLDKLKQELESIKEDMKRGVNVEGAMRASCMALEFDKMKHLAGRLECRPSAKDAASNAKWNRVRVSPCSR